MNNTMDLALIMIFENAGCACKRDKTLQGIRYKLLVSEKEIIEALLAEGKVILDCSNQRAVG